MKASLRRLLGTRSEIGFKKAWEMVYQLTMYETALKQMC